MYIAGVAGRSVNESVSKEERHRLREHDAAVRFACTGKYSGSEQLKKAWRFALKFYARSRLFLTLYVACCIMVSKRKNATEIK